MEGERDFGAWRARGIRWAICALLALLALPVLAQKPVGRDDPDTAWKKSVQGFGAALMLTEDPDAFVREWMRAPQDQRPNLKPVSSVKLGGKVSGLVFFWGCHPANGDCDVVADFMLVRPGGGIADSARDRPVIKAPQPRRDLVYLGASMIRFEMDPKYPRGEYRVVAMVREASTGIVLDLTQSFRVVE